MVAAKTYPREVVYRTRKVCPVCGGCGWALDFESPVDPVWGRKIALALVPCPMGCDVAGTKIETFDVHRGSFVSNSTVQGRVASLIGGVPAAAPVGSSLDVRCPRCHAAPGVPCVTQSGRPAVSPHTPRWTLAGVTGGGHGD